MSKAKSPAAELAALKRKITPRVLTGKAKDNWDHLVIEFTGGALAGATMQELFEWAQTHCGLNCSLHCFRQALLATRDRSAL